MAPLLPRVVAELVGPLELAEFSVHYAMLGAYTLLHAAATAAQLRERVGDGEGGAARAYADYSLSCALDALAFGSGLDGGEGAWARGELPTL